MAVATFLHWNNPIDLLCNFSDYCYDCRPATLLPDSGRRWLRNLMLLWAWNDSYDPACFYYWGNAGDGRALFPSLGTSWYIDRFHRIVSVSTRNWSRKTGMLSDSTLQKFQSKAKKE